LVRKAGARRNNILSRIQSSDAEQAEGLGLPGDWRFVTPRNWSTVETRLAGRLNPALRDSSPVDLAGIRVARSSGQIQTGKLDPVGPAVELPSSVAAIVTSADDALNLEVLNRDFNPFVSDPRG